MESGVKRAKCEKRKVDTVSTFENPKSAKFREHLIRIGAKFNEKC